MLFIFVIISFFCQLYQQGRLCQLGGEFCELEVFAKVLRASDKRYERNGTLPGLKPHTVHADPLSPRQKASGDRDPLSRRLLEWFIPLMPSSAFTELEIQLDVVCHVWTLSGLIHLYMTAI